MHNLSHLSVRCCEAATLFAVRQKLAEMHRTRFVEAEAECSFAQRARETREEVSGCGLVIPNVSAVAKAAAKLVVHAFEPWNSPSAVRKHVVVASVDRI